MDHRTSTKKALDRYFTKQAKRDAPKQKRTNGKPEKELEKLIMAWLKSMRFSCHVVESKAVFNKQAGTYVRGQTISGMSDIVGCTPDGLGCFIELKAPGQRAALKPHQRKFLQDKIRLGCFAVCVDSVDLLDQLWQAFMVTGDLSDALPKERVKRNPEGVKSLWEDTE